MTFPQAAGEQQLSFEESAEPVCEGQMKNRTATDFGQIRREKAD